MIMKTRNHKIPLHKHAQRLRRNKAILVTMKRVVLNCSPFAIDLIIYVPLLRHKFDELMRYLPITLQHVVIANLVFPYTFIIS